MRLAQQINVPILRLCMSHKLVVIGFALGVLVVAFGMIAPNLGSEFVPRLSEGAIVINVVRLAGTDISESIRTNTLMEKTILRAFPDEVEHVWTRIGTAEIATDPMGVELSDLFITLKPRSRWKKAETQAQLSELIDKELRTIPGQRLAFTQPIEMRLNEMLSGGRTDVTVKVFGDDFSTLTAKANEVEQVLRTVAGNADLAVEQLVGQGVLEIQVRQDEIARYGVPAKAVLDLVESIGSKPLGEIVEGQLRFPLVVRLPEKYRNSPEAIGSILIATPSGERIPLSRLAAMRMVEGPATITREWGQRRIAVTCNVRGRDLGSFVAEARRKVAEQVQVPVGRYHVEWGGQFEQLERARARLLIVVPLCFVLIFGLLYLTYGNVVDALRVFTGIPFAWVGGIFALWLRDMPFSISAAVGFIALSGVAVLDDMILVSYVRQLRAKGLALDEAVQQAAVTRLRPVLMTTLVASLGFLPMAFSTGMGAEVQRPLATVVIGGVVGAMVMSLLVLRVLYVIFQLPSREKSDSAARGNSDPLSRLRERGGMLTAREPTRRLLPVALPLLAGDAAGVLAELLGPIGRRGEPTSIVEILRLVGGDAARTQLAAVGTKPQTPQRVVELLPGGLPGLALLCRGLLHLLPSLEEAAGVVLRPAELFQERGLLLGQLIAQMLQGQGGLPPGIFQIGLIGGAGGRFGRRGGGGGAGSLAAARIARSTRAGLL